MSSVESAVTAIRAQLPAALQSPKVGIVCGSGLSGLADVLAETVIVSYADIPGFGQSTVHGHKSSLAFGLLGVTKVPVVCQLGRFHAYEGFPMSQIIYPMQVMKGLGIEITILTNAAGSLDPNLNVGTIVPLLDHISLPSLTSWNPLIGPNDDSVGPRFPPMSDAYDFELRKVAFRASHALNFERGALIEGVYAWVAGPTYETKAEQKFLHLAGASVVGMSTVPEVIAARHLGIRVLTLSLVTNIVAYKAYQRAQLVVEAELKGQTLKEIEEDEVASHEEVLEVGRRKANDVRSLVEKVVELLYPTTA